MTFIPADTIEDVFAAAFNGGKSRPGANGARTTRNSRPLRT
jgi:hypothetical protein